MASTTSPEASEIRRRGRRRLLGAVTLVLLAVVFIPMILDNEPRPQRTEPSLTIPPKENAAPLPAPAPAQSSPTPAAPASSSRTPKSGDGPGPNPAPAKVEPVPSASRAPQSGNAPGPDAPAKAAAPQPKLEGFAVQVGAFRDETRLQQARAKLEAAGIAHYTERVDASGGAMTRLRAGPFPTREAAEKARAKLQEGQVVPLP